MAKKISKGTLNRIKKHLPEGWKEAIASELALKPETVRKVMGNIRQNKQVVKAAVELSALPIEEKSKLLTRIV